MFAFDEPVQLKSLHFNSYVVFISDIYFIYDIFVIYR